MKRNLVKKRQRDREDRVGERLNEELMRKSDNRAEGNVFKFNNYSYFRIFSGILQVTLTWGHKTIM